MVTRAERRWVLLFACVVVLVTAIPYLVGFWTQGKDWVYSGFIFGLDDGNSYLSKMLRGASGDWLFRTPYTAYPQSGMIAFLPYLILGKLTAPPDQHVQLIALFQLFRAAAGFLMIWGTYAFIAYFIPDVSRRRFGTALAILGGGVGWVSILGLKGLFHSGLPLEFYSPETFGFLSIFGLPHLAAARGLLLMGLLAYLRETDWKKAAALGGSAWFLMGFFQPLTVIIGWVVLAAHLGILLVIIFSQQKTERPAEWRDWWAKVKCAAAIGVVSSPMAVYNALAFQLDPFLGGWYKQNIITSPPALDYLLAYLPLLPLVIIAWIRIVQTRSRSPLLIASWVPLALILVYLPYNLQRRLAEGSWAAWIILALIGLASLSDRWIVWIRRFLWTTFLPAVLLLAGGLAAVMAPQRPLYLPVSVTSSFQVLGENAQRDDVVLASFELANYIPAWIPIRTLNGHGPESVHLSEVTEQIDQFFSVDADPVESRQFLQQYGVKYVYLSPDEMKIRGLRPEDISRWGPVKSGILNVIYNQDNVTLFRVNLPGRHDQ